MSLLSKITLGFVFIAALLFWFLSMRTLKTHEAWRSAVKDHTLKIEEVEKKTTTVMEGEQGKLSMGQLRTNLNAALFGRGKAWMDATARFENMTGNVIVSIPQPQPHQITVGMILHAFQGLDDPSTARYMGEFKVAAADANTNALALTPTYTPTAARRAVLQQARGPWALYEVLPADKNEMFTGMSEDQIETMLPPAPRRLPGEVEDDFQARLKQHQDLLTEYKQDNKVVQPNDLPEWLKLMGVQVVIKFNKDQADLTEQQKGALRAIDFGENLVKSGAVMRVDLPTATELTRLGLATEVERRYQRKLRDYSYVVREFHRRLPLLEDEIANLQKDLDYMVQANQEAQKHLAEVRVKEDAMKQELTLVEKERQVVATFRETLQARLEKINTEIARLSEENQRLAAQLAQRQLRAVQGAGRSATATALAPSR